MEKNKKKATGWDARVRGELRNFSEFYALLVTPLSLPNGWLDYEMDGVMLLRGLRCFWL